MEPSKSLPSSSITITVEFTGGLEMLFSNQRQHRVSLPATDESDRTATLGFLVRYLCQHLMRDQRRELFVLNDVVRPGILVLINDADWGLEGEENYEPKHGDSILFVSTLHGG